MKKILFSRFARAMIGMAVMDPAPASARSTVLRLVGSRMRFKAGRAKATLAPVMIMLIAVLFPRLASATSILPAPTVSDFSGFIFATGQATKGEETSLSGSDPSESSASSAIQSINTYSYRITAQTSADGSVSNDGDIGYFFDYKVPYYFNQHVVIDQSGPVTTATFPVVNLDFLVEAQRDLIVNPNDIHTYSGDAGAQRTYVDPVTVTGTGLADTDILPGHDDIGSYATWYSCGLDNQYICPSDVYNGYQHVHQENSVSLERTALGAPTGDFSLYRGTALDGSTIYWDDSFYNENEFNYLDIGTTMWADSDGGTTYQIPISGGEAMACMGQNSGLSSFSFGCPTNDNGITVTAQWDVASYVTLPVEFVGDTATPNVEQWRVLPDTQPVPEPGTASLAFVGLVGLAFVYRKREGIVN